MARRSSARLRSRNSSTPKRVSLSHDTLPKTPRTAPSKLSALQESDEMPGAFPQSESPPSMLTADAVNVKSTTVPVKFDNATPQDRTPIKPAAEEMHPKQHQQSTAKPLDEARWLGFAKMPPHSEPPKQASKIATLQGTPTKASKVAPGTGSPKFQFTFGREQSLELSPEGKKLMNAMRGEAAKIREQMSANGEGPNDIAGLCGRKFATPKGKKGRFSDAHLEQFSKMDSIAGHASAFRSNPSQKKATASLTQGDTDASEASRAKPSPGKSLKRSPSKAQLDDSDDTPQRSFPRNLSKPALAQTTDHFPPPTSSKKLPSVTLPEPSSPPKRVKRNEADDVSTARPSSSEGAKGHPATPQQKKISSSGPSYPDLSTFNSQTLASLARAISTKSAHTSKIPAPALSRSPSKQSLQNVDHDSPKPYTPLLARSPSKISIFAREDIEKPRAMMSPLLMRTPTKASPFKKTVEIEEKEGQKKPKSIPLLSRSPLKMSVAKETSSEPSNEKNLPPVSFLARSPAKITLPTDGADVQSAQTPTKSPGGNLMHRFGLLRASPVKSILRSPQRLYSDDPAKVAAGTHFATPPNHAANISRPLPPTPTAMTPAEKHVDFTSSTKARYERAQSEATSSSSKESNQSPETHVEQKSSSKPSLVEYPTLASEECGPVVTPQKRRQTVAPGDFTFTSHGHGIIFAQSPNAPASAAKSKLPSTIRHVSAEAQLPVPPPHATGTKKRKFDFENDRAAEADDLGSTSDKENTDETGDGRPAKRVKPSAPELPPTKSATRVLTLGVRPKKTVNDGKDKRPTIISKAKLNALAQPKRRT